MLYTNQITKIKNISIAIEIDHFLLENRSALGAMFIKIAGES
jgi:hypothetical protein